MEMLKLANENIETMTIKFEGSDDIDLETLSTVLRGTVNSLKIIADNNLDAEQYCKFKLKDVRKGSIILDISSIIVSNYAPLFTSLPTIITAFNDCLSIKKHLMGKEPKNIKKVDDKHIEIENNSGNIQIYNIDTVNMYGSNDALERELTKCFKTVNKDTDRTGMTFITSRNNEPEKAISFSNSELQSCSELVDVSKLTTNVEESTTEEILRVIKADFFGNSKWTFFLNNQRIEADIKDEVFLDKVHQNQILFDGNTRLKVQLLIRYKIDSNGIPIEDEKATYTVLMVLDVIQNNIEKKTLFS